MEVEVSYEILKNIVNEFGWDDLLLFLQDMCPTFDLYNVSTSWFKNKNYILKAKGVHGDLIISWL